MTSGTQNLKLRPKFNSVTIISTTKGLTFIHAAWMPVWAFNYRCKHLTVYFICIVPASCCLSVPNSKANQHKNSWDETNTIVNFNTFLLTYTSQIKKLSFKRDPSTPGRWSRVFPTDFKTKQVIFRIVFYQSHHILCAAINHPSFWIHWRFQKLLQKTLLHKQHEVSSHKIYESKSATIKN